MATQSQSTAKYVAVLASSFTDRALTAHAALVHGMGHQRLTPAELSTQLTLVDYATLDVAQSERTLAVGWRTIACT
jgi:hypothetical protein